MPRLEPLVRGHRREHAGALRALDRDGLELVPAIETEQTIDAPPAEPAILVVQHDPSHDSRLAAERGSEMTTIRGPLVATLSWKKEGFQLGPCPRPSSGRQKTLLGLVREPLRASLGMDFADSGTDSHITRIEPAARLLPLISGSFLHFSASGPPSCRNARSQERPWHPSPRASLR